MKTPNELLTPANAILGLYGYKCYFMLDSSLVAIKTNKGHFICYFGYNSTTLLNEVSDFLTKITARLNLLPQPQKSYFDTLSIYEQIGINSILTFVNQT